MAAAIALLRAAGVLKKSTAAEHATSSSSIATEHATTSSPSDPAASTDEIFFCAGSKENRTAAEHARSSTSIATEQATSSVKIENKESRFWLKDTDYRKIVALLQWMAKAYAKVANISDDEIEKAAIEAIFKQYKANTTFNKEAIAALSELIDIIMLHKDGKPKDPDETLKFMRRVASIRDDVRAESSNNATECTAEQVSLCYQWFGRVLLTHDLLPHQKQDHRYIVRNRHADDTSMSSFQRSFVNSQIRKNVGDKKVAMLIWQHGMPRIADAPLVRCQQIIVHRCLARGTCGQLSFRMYV